MDPDVGTVHHTGGDSYTVSTGFLDFEVQPLHRVGRSWVREVVLREVESIYGGKAIVDGAIIPVDALARVLAIAGWVVVPPIKPPDWGGR